MASLKVEVPHQFSEDEALNRLKTFSKSLKNRFAGQISEVQENWKGNQGDFSFVAKGYRLAGVINVGPSTVVIDLQLPFVASFFKDRIEKMIRQEAEKVLAGGSSKTEGPIAKDKQTSYSRPIYSSAINCAFYGSLFFIAIRLITELSSNSREVGNTKITREDAKKAVRTLQGIT